MAASLFIESHAHGLAFYINGDLQFDTADEAIYHEYLVIPAIALAVQRFPDTPLRILIAGGGDGLAARDVLRFSPVYQIDLVDYSPEVLELGRTVFQPYNQGSLLEDADAPLGSQRLTVHTQDALEFIAHLPDACYHAVICDFTYPTRPQDCRIYSQEWFQQVRRILHPGGLVGSNGVSPQYRPAAFWCLYQTLLASGLEAKPLQVAIPSFHRHGYGDWGFFLASSLPIGRSHLETLTLPDNLRAFDPATLTQRFQFSHSLASLRHTVCLTTLDLPQLFYYLLNPLLTDDTPQTDPYQPVDFLTVQEAWNQCLPDAAGGNLAAIAQRWLEQFHAEGEQAASGNLFPVQHRYHTPRMTREWLEHLRGLLKEIDLPQLVNSLLERASELPPQLAQELKIWQEKIRRGEPLTYLSDHATQLIVVLSVTLLMANLTAPDAVFAKGFTSSGYRSGGSGGDYYYGGDFPWMGFWMTAIGGCWLWSLYENRRE